MAKKIKMPQFKQKREFFTETVTIVKKIISIKSTCLGKKYRKRRNVQNLPKSSLSYRHFTNIKPNGKQIG